MANRIVSVHAGIYGMGIYAIMLPSNGFSVAHYRRAGVYFYSIIEIRQCHCPGVAWKLDQSDVTLIVEHSNNLKFMSNI